MREGLGLTEWSSDHQLAGVESGQLHKVAMSGFYGRSLDDDGEVEKLLEQVQDESLLKLSLNNHRSTNGFQAPSLPSSAALHGDDCGGLESNLLVRFANLKSRPVQPTVKKIKDKDGATDTAPKARVEDDAEAESEKDEDALMAELEERLTALKPGLQASSHSSNWQSCLSTKSSSSPSSIHSSSPSLQTSPTTGRSFSPLKLLKQFSGAKRAPTKTRSMNDRIFSTDDDSVKPCISKDRANTAPADKLLASAVDEVMLERKKGRPKKHVDEEEDVFDIFDDGSLLHGDLKDLNLKQLKKELSKASVEEDRLSREAAEVIEWAKDAARLDPPSAIDGEDADLEELLKLEEQQDEEARLKDQKKKKKKKGKKWSLF